MKQLLVLVAVVGIILSSCGKSGQTAKLKNETDSISYYIGIAFGKQLKSIGLTDYNATALAKGMNEAFKKDSLKITDEELNMKLSTYVALLRQRASEKNLKAGQDFLAKNKEKKGVQTLPSGLQYEVVKEGSGPMPDSSSLVTCHYTLYHIDGKVVESSEKREPAKFLVTQVIPGWTEALLKMRVGSKWKLYVPTNLAYGENIRPDGPLKANEALIFDIELLNVEKNPEPVNPNVK